MNWLMLLGVIALVLASASTNLAAAYGIAVTGTMIITDAVGLLVARRQWGWRKRLALPVFGALPLVHRPRLLLRQFDQDPRRRLVPAGLRPGGLSVADDLEAGREAAARAARIPRPCPCAISFPRSKRRIPSPCPAPRCS
jgi:Zn-dependent protease with chaperone function